MAAITASQPGLLVALLGPAVVVGGQRTQVFERTAPSFINTADLSPEGETLLVGRYFKKPFLRLSPRTSSAASMADLAGLGELLWGVP